MSLTAVTAIALQAPPGTPADAAPSQTAAPAWTHAAAWGFNTSGQLGDGTQISRGSPVAVAEAGRGFVKVASGADHSVAIAADGTLWSWGANDQGQLGDGTATGRPAPAQVPGMTNITEIAAGRGFTLAVRSDGTLWSWGRNDSGQLGTGAANVSQPVPRQVPGLTGITDVAAGTAHGLAARSDGTAWAWGLNDSGQLGDATTISRPTPVPVAGLTGVAAVAGGLVHSLALRSDGTVWSWGSNGAGELGDGTVGNRLTPVKALKVAHITDIAAGERHSLAVSGDGTLFAWGLNGSGQLGDGTTTDRSVPYPVPGLSGVVQATAGFRFSAALRSDGTVWSWGLNYQGQLGDGTATHRLTPAQVPGLTDVSQLDAGPRQDFNTASHTLVIRRVPAPAFSISLGSASGNLPAGGSLSITVTTHPINGSTQTVAFAVGTGSEPANAVPIGLPPGVTAVFSPPSVVADGSSTLTLTASPQTTPTHGEPASLSVVGYATSPTGTASAPFDLSIIDPPCPATTAPGTNAARSSTGSTPTTTDAPSGPKSSSPRPSRLRRSGRTALAPAGSGTPTTTRPPSTKPPACGLKRQDAGGLPADEVGPLCWERAARGTSLCGLWTLWP
ncbi:hypothetical protein AAH991_37235 [Microbispora sp. ZYX-F-249]|uniref:RCC1-like domain-containing protein n=1 Tax=Microbispora maris TaxID=3144104 RepID=A0ABV0B170_9ACTN